MSLQVIYMFVSVVIMLTLSNNTVKCDFVGNRIRIAQCRTTCFEQFIPFAVRKSVSGFIDSNYCSTKNNWKCNMCWDYCDMLLLDAKTQNQMCNDDICMAGCKYACAFYESSSAPPLESSVAVVEAAAAADTHRKNILMMVVADGMSDDKTNNDEFQVSQLNISPHKISWKIRGKLTEQAALVYIVFGHYFNNDVIELHQTTDSKLIYQLTQESRKLHAISIAVVNRSGLLTSTIKKLTYKLLRRNRRQNQQSKAQSTMSTSLSSGSVAAQPTLTKPNENKQSVVFFYFHQHQGVVVVFIFVLAILIVAAVLFLIITISVRVNRTHKSTLSLNTVG